MANGEETTGYRVGDTIEFETIINSEHYGNLTNVSVRQGSKNNLVGSIVLESSGNENIKIDYDSYSCTILKISGEKCNISSSYLFLTGDGGKNGSKAKYYVTITASKENGTSVYAYTETKEILIEPEPDNGT